MHNIGISLCLSTTILKVGAGWSPLLKVILNANSPNTSLLFY